MHDAYLRLIGQNLDGVKVEDYHHFFALVSQTMRLILVEHARRYQAVHRAPPKGRLSLEDDRFWNRTAVAHTLDHSGRTLFPESWTNGCSWVASEVSS